VSEVVAVCVNPRHGITKPAALSIRLIANHGVEGDAHAGATVKHRSRVRANRVQPNLRQVHLIHAELIDELNAAGFNLGRGMMDENITTRGLDLLGLSAGALLRLGPAAVVEITGLRNPCTQLDGLRPGLMQAVLGRAADGRLIRKCGIMGVVRASGEVSPGAAIVISSPNERRPLAPV
jgi:MOSC domain-containing protein YiiM